jgi:ubiquinone/menaquinone biosynthesis C-methylase UbiE/accessory colonization factor AcfC
MSNFGYHNAKLYLYKGAALIMRLFARTAIILLAGLWLALASTADESVRLAAPSDLQRVLPEVAAVYEAESGNKVTAAYYDDSAVPNEKHVSISGKDVLIAALYPMEMAVEEGLVARATTKALFCRRLALGVQRTNPKLIISPADLARPGLRVGVMKQDRGYLGTETKEIIGQWDFSVALQKNIVFYADRPDALAGALLDDRVDAVICWDTLENLAPEKIVIMRMAGFEPYPILAGILRASSGATAAGKLIEFMAASDPAQNIYGSYGYALAEKSGEAVRESEFYRNFHKHNFYYIYQLLAQQILDDYGFAKGIAVDIGCGGCQTLIHMARLTDLECVGLDIEPEILEVAEQNVAEAGFSERFRFVAGDVHNIPLPDDYADLIMSRGSIPFWRDRVRAFEEIYRVLKPGGVAFIGGGGSRYLTDAYFKQIKAPWVTPERREKLGIPRFGSLEGIMARTNIPAAHYKIIKEGGNWVELRK